MQWAKFHTGWDGVCKYACFIDMIRMVREAHYAAVQCFCGNDLINGAVPASDSDCNMGCGGNAT